MTENEAHRHDAAAEQSTTEAWREVGRQFEVLGESLSKAFRAAWQSEETKQHVRSMQDGLEKLVDKVDQAVKEARESQRGEKLRIEAERTAESLRQAGEQTWQEARPQLLSALKRANAELQGVIVDLEKRSASDSESSAGPSGGASEGTSRETGQD